MSRRHHRGQAEPYSPTLTAQSIRRSFGIHDTPHIRVYNTWGASEGAIIPPTAQSDRAIRSHLLREGWVNRLDSPEVVEDFIRAIRAARNAGARNPHPYRAYGSIWAVAIPAKEANQ